jgi:hypothetical protein
MWIIKHIFDGDYGCEEAEPGSKPRVAVTLENESGEQRYETIEDAWLTEKERVALIVQIMKNRQNYGYLQRRGRLL